MPKTRWHIRIAAVLLCAVISIHPATSAEISGSRFIVDSWSSKERLPQVSVLSIIQTKDGYLWLGTLKGLVRFDGNSFTVFDQYNTPGLSSDAIVRLFEDSHTNLWIGTDTAGVAMLRDGKVKNFAVGGEGHEGRLMAVCEDSAGDVWFYTADTHLGRYQSNRMEVLNLNITNTPSTATVVNCRTVVADSSGLIWIGEGWQEAGGGLFGFHSSAFQPPVMAFDQYIMALKLDLILASQRGGMWRLVDGRVQKWNSNVREKDFGDYPWGSAPVTTACEDRDGNLVVGTLGEGIFWYDANGQHRHISTGEGLSSPDVVSLCVDREGNLWVGTDGGGLNRVKRKVFDAPVEYQSQVVQSISKDANGGVWMALNRAGVSYLKGNSTRNLSVSLNSTAWSILVDSKQRVWAGTRGEGLFQFQTNQFQSIPNISMLGLQIFALFEDRAGQIWVGTQYGLLCWNGRIWKAFTKADGLSENIIRAVAEDAQGNLWVGTESQGLNLFKEGKFASHQSDDKQLPGKGISSLYVDSDGALWIGTSGHGLARFHNGKWGRFSTDDGLVSNHIAYIVEDSEGYLWLGSNMGLMRIKKSSLNDFADKKTNSFSCRTYVESDGLPTRECSSGSQPAACCTPDGRLWFPTVNGLVSVTPEVLKPNLQPPIVLFESVKVDDREQMTNRLNSAWSQSVVVPPGQNQLEINYTALNFSAPKEVRFRYRLEGRDSKWTDVAQTRVAYLNGLWPGQYRFRVTAANEDGVWNETGSVLELTVLPQFWQTRWFLVVTVLILLGIIISAVRYVSTQKLQRELQSFKQQEALEKERFRIARDLHDQLGANLTQVALLSEMAEEDKNSPTEVESHAQQIAQTARDTTRSLDEIVWAVNPSNDTLEGLVNYACKYAQDYFALAGVSYRVDMPTQLPAIPIPPEVRHNAFLAFKEAVNNVVKHANASEVWVRSQLQPDHFTLEIEDNGRGMGDVDPDEAKSRNGLHNMRKRMEDIHGEFSIAPGETKGTIVRLKIPLAIIV